MAAKLVYLCRGPDGRMRSVVAHSARGAADLYLARYRPPRGGAVSVKPRGQGDWECFEVR